MNKFSRDAQETNTKKKQEREKKIDRENYTHLTVDQAKQQQQNTRSITALIKSICDNIKIMEEKKTTNSI